MDSATEINNLVFHYGELVDQGRILAAGPHPAVDSEDPGEAGFTGRVATAPPNKSVLPTNTASRCTAAR